MLHSSDDNEFPARNRYTLKGAFRSLYQNIVSYIKGTPNGDIGIYKPSSEAFYVAVVTGDVYHRIFSIFPKLREISLCNLTDRNNDVFYYPPRVGNLLA